MAYIILREESEPELNFLLYNKLFRSCELEYNESEYLLIMSRILVGANTNPFNAGDRLIYNLSAAATIYLISHSHC